MDRLEQNNIVKEVRDSFLDYSMSVIVARALPDLRDGLKPVHRRILYSMYESGYTPDKPHKKSARIVGDVMGKYHPHGDSSIYEAMVRMAQDFSYRYHRDPAGLGYSCRPYPRQICAARHRACFPPGSRRYGWA